MWRLGILLIVFGICLPAYGYILVYKSTGSDTIAYFETDPNGWLLEKNSRSGYLILDVNDEDPNILDDVQYINIDLKEKRCNIPFWEAGKGFAQSILPSRSPKGKNITILNIDLWGRSGGLELTGCLLGTNSLKDIGTMIDEEKTKVDVATSLKGSCEYISGRNLGDIDEILYEQGTGTLTLTLDSKWTKRANNPDEFNGNIDAFLDGLLNWLIDNKHYIPVVYPLPF